MLSKVNWTRLCHRWYKCTVLWRVMAQVSCELVAPKESRPNEGIMFFNIELSPLASPTFEQGRYELNVASVCLFVTHTIPLWNWATHSNVTASSPTVCSDCESPASFLCFPPGSRSCRWSLTDSWRDAWGTPSALIRSPCVWSQERRYTRTHTHACIYINAIEKKGFRT